MSSPLSPAPTEGERVNPYANAAMAAAARLPAPARIHLIEFPRSLGDASRTAHEVEANSLPPRSACLSCEERDVGLVGRIRGQVRLDDSRRGDVLPAARVVHAGRRL